MVHPVYPKYYDSLLPYYCKTSLTRTLMTCLPLADLNSLLSPQKILRTAQENKYLGIFQEFFLFYNESVCCVYSLESHHHTIIVYKIEKSSLNYSHLLPDLATWLILSSSNYSCLKHFSMVPKMFEPLRFDCIFVLKFESIHFTMYRLV